VLNGAIFVTTENVEIWIHIHSTFSAVKDSCSPDDGLMMVET
jgi:hypothetical protein